MTSPGILESLKFGSEGASLASAKLFSESQTATAAATDEHPLAFFLGVNQHAWLFTSQRLLMLKGNKSLARQMAGGSVVDFARSRHALSVTEILEQTRIRQEIPVTAISWLDAERRYSAGVVILFACGRKHELTVGQKRAELLPFMEDLRQRFSIPPSAARQAMKRDLRVWALFSIVSGLLTFLLSFAYPGLLEPVWGLTVAFIGTGVWCLSEPAMFIVLGMGMAWAAMMNLCGLNSSLLNTGSNGGHLSLGVPLQLYWAATLFVRFRRYEHLYDYDHTPSVQEAGISVGGPVTETPLLPWFSSGIAVTTVTLLSLYLSFLWRWPANITAMIPRGCLHLAMIGMAIGIASLYSRRARRVVAITGTTINAVVALILLTLLMTKWHQL